MKQEEKPFFKKLYQLCNNYYSINNKIPDNTFRFKDFNITTREGILYISIVYVRGSCFHKKFKLNELKKMLQVHYREKYIRISMHQFYNIVNRNNLKEQIISTIQLSLIEEL